MSAQTYSYDLNGNLTSDANHSYEWDGENRLSAINYNGTNKRTEFSYDGLSRRVRIVEKDGAAVTSDKRFVWDGIEIAEERDGAEQLTKRFYSQGVSVNAQPSALNYYFTRDHLGSVREVTDANGSVQASYTYDLYGQRTKTSGSFDADFGFTGHYFHAPSVLHLALYRAYDAELGRWLNRDPIGEEGPDGPNLYGYVRNNPINLVDPLGEWGIGWGDGNGNVSFNIGWGHPTFLFTPQSGMDVSMAAGATLDGIIPFADPYADAGAYDECDPSFAFSRGAGQFARDVYTGRLLLGGVARLGASRLPGTRWINSNRYLRLGESGNPPQLTLRIGQARPVSPWNHIPIE